jgi:hypothetical protein
LKKIDELWIPATVRPARRLFMYVSILHYRIGILFYLATIGGVLGQVATTSQPVQQASSSSATLQTSQNEATLQAFQQEQQALARQEQALVAGGATREQIKAWRQENASLFAVQQQRAQAMAVASALTLQRENSQPRIPPCASPTLENYLTTQAALANARAHIHNQLVQQAAASGQSLTLAQVNKLERQVDRLFRQQNAALLTLQTQRSQALANAAAQTGGSVPGPGFIPPNATPQMAAYLTTQYQIRQELTQIRNQYANATPAAREAAIQTWRAQNADLFAQLQQETRSLSQASTTTQN